MHGRKRRSTAFSILSMHSRLPGGEGDNPFPLIAAWPDVRGVTGILGEDNRRIRR